MRHIGFHIYRYTYINDGPITLVVNPPTLRSVRENTFWPLHDILTDLNNFDILYFNILESEQNKTYKNNKNETFKE